MARRHRLDLAVPERTCSVLVEGRLASASGTRPAAWQVAEEVPVSLLIDSAPLAVMMATPADLEDFAVGFLVGEGLIGGLADVAGVLVLPVEGGIGVDVALAGELRRPAPERAMAGRSGCGLCGVREIAEVLRELPRRELAPLAPAAVIRAFAELPAHQPMNAANHSVHAAAWCRRDGAVVMAREDVGRHNALDKLIGAVLRQGLDPGTGFVAMSSRCSYELVQKAAMAGFGGLATLSAPTSLALDLAHRAGLAVACRAGDGAMLFTP